MPDEKQTQEKKAERKVYFRSTVKVSFGRNVTDPGNPIKKNYRWKEGKRGLKEVGETDLQKEIDAAAMGCSPSEQIVRILRGDTSCIPSEDPLPGGDYTGLADKTRNEILAEGLKPLNVMTGKAQDAGICIEELEEEYKKQLEELKAKKAALDAAKGETPKAEDDKGGEQK